VDTDTAPSHRSNSPVRRGDQKRRPPEAGDIDLRQADFDSAFRSEEFSFWELDRYIQDVAHGVDPGGYVVRSRFEIRDAAGVPEMVALGHGLSLDRCAQRELGRSSGRDN